MAFSNGCACKKYYVFGNSDKISGTSNIEQNHKKWIKYKHTVDTTVLHPIYGWYITCYTVHMYVRTIWVAQTVPTIVLSWSKS